MQSGLYFVHTLVCDVVVEGTVLLSVHVGGLCHFPGYSGTTGHSGGSCGSGGVMACKKKVECKDLGTMHFIGVYVKLISMEKYG